MEAFEGFVALAMEAEGLVVSEAVKFPVRLPTRRKDHVEVQQHGYEVDLVGARADRLVLATVKSYLGSRGVVAEHVSGDTKTDVLARRFSLLNRPEVRGPVLRAAARRYGYRTSEVELRLYVGKFAGRRGETNEELVRAWARKQRVGVGKIRVFNLAEVVAAVRPAAVPTEYRDNPVLVTWKVLGAAGLLSAPA
ncbi:MAG: hypothetical protein ACLQBB_06960 [Solirubrobacteraceae bacterium]